MIKTALFLLGSFIFTSASMTSENYPVGTLVECQDQKCLWMGQNQKLVNEDEILNQMMQVLNVKEEHFKRNLQSHIQYIQGNFSYTCFIYYKHKNLT